VLLNAELVEPGPCVPESPLDREKGSPQPLSHSVTAPEPEPSRQDASDEQDGDGNQKNGAKSESRQQPAQQKPQSAERESATAQLLPIY
jgi:hypothetical protein